MISEATKQAYGIGPKQLLIRVSLSIATTHSLPVGITKVETTMRRYGFTNRKKFADFTGLCIRSTSATLQGIWTAKDCGNLSLGVVLLVVTGVTLAKSMASDTPTK